MQSPLLLFPLTAFACTFLLHLLALRFFPRWGLLDFPERYGLLRSRIPYPTGILSVMVFLGFFLTFQSLTLPNVGIAFSLLLLAVISFFDDRLRIAAWKRFLVQLLIGTLVYLTGTRIFSLTNPLEPLTGIAQLQLDAWVVPSALFSNPALSGLLFTILWLGFTMNALNWFDGIPGQVSVLSTIGFLTIGFLSLSDRVSQPELALLAFVLAGIALAGCFFDFPPARVLMGDTGSMFFGLMLGILTVYSGGKVATAFLVLGVPLIDSGLVTLRRLSAGRSPFSGSASGEHLHHRLLAKGWSERRIVLVTAVLGSAFGISALFLSTTEKFVAACVFGLVMLALSHYASCT